MESIGDVYIGVMDIVGSSKNVCLYLSREPVIDTSAGTYVPENGITGLVEFKNVSFSYPSREDKVVLKDINFTAKCGEV